MTYTVLTKDRVPVLSTGMWREARREAARLRSAEHVGVVQWVDRRGRLQERWLLDSPSIEA